MAAYKEAALRRSGRVIMVDEECQADSPPRATLVIALPVAWRR